MKAMKPTDAELSVLKILWERGACTVAEVHERLEGERGYTTSLKTLQVMLERGLVNRDESGRAHLYTAAIPREAEQKRIVADVTNRLFGGSASELALHALAQTTSPEDLAEIRRLIDKLQEKA